ncbi:hypothetical protein [Pseudomonas sp. PB106]|uniref:hypothetical protein n=1 Tax=Pseudomonas sp. PB106 TaxID=2494699 RepID=UPI00131B29B3|nr:hypothetical protein [Pseudomonas sp. PB106]KAE9643021.1 hypothetical protein EJA71_18095 [Pseudomonas sp. PB106]
MAEREERYYEDRILHARGWFVFWSVLAIAIPIIVTLTVGVLDKPSSWISRSGAVMAGIAFLAHLKSDAMMGVLKPSGMVDKSFKPTKDKYFRQIVLCGRIAIAIVFIGSLVWGFGDLLPVGKPSP